MLQKDGQVRTLLETLRRQDPRRTRPPR